MFPWGRVARRMTNRCLGVDREDISSESGLKGEMESGLPETITLPVQGPRLAIRIPC